jgi:hypothetical protein
MSRRSFSPRDRRRRAAPPDMAVVPIGVSDHALVRYLERVLDIDMERLRTEIGIACARHQGAPCVKAGGARFMIRHGVVVTVIDDRTVPMFPMLADLARGGRDE